MAATKQRERARVDLNSALAAAHARIWQREDKLAAAATGVLKQAGKIAARQFKKKVQPHLVAAGGPVWTPPPADEVVDVDAIVAALRTKSDPIRQSAIAEYGKALSESYPDVNWDIANPLVGGVLSGSAQHVTYIADTTRLNVMRTIREAYDQGLSIPDTAKAIQEGMSAASSARGRLIARTELAAVSNGGALAATRLVADATGDTYWKRWNTAPGAPHPRHELVEMLDGQTVALEDQFDVDGEALDFPGDPNGSPENVCNCRCALTFPSELREGQQGASPEPTSNLASPAEFGAVSIGGLDGNDAAQLATVISGNAAAMDMLVSATMRAVVEPLGGRFEGWQFRLKSKESIARKIETDIGLRAKVPNEIAATNIRDGLRYTAVYQPGEYVAKMTQTLDQLRGAGFRAEEVNPYWAKGGPYAGTNVIMQAPNGYRFELQFHTPQSFNVKEFVNHDQYERWRLIEDKNSPEARALFSQMAGEADKVMRPPGIHDWNYQGSVETTVGITPFREGVDDPIGFYDSDKYKRFEADVQQLADRYGVTLDAQERATGVWQGSEEPSAQLHVHDGVLGVRAFSADLARAYRQDGAALFGGIGDDVIAEFPAGLDHDAVYAAMHEAGLDAGTFTADGRFEAMGTGGDFIKALDSVATRLGVDYDAQLGDFTLLLKENGDYEKAIGDFGRLEAQQARAAEARTPGGVAGRAAVREGAQGAPGGIGQVAPSALQAPSVAPPSPPRQPPPYTANQLKRLSTDNLYGTLAELGKAENAARAEIASPGQGQVIDELWRRGDQRLPAGTLRYEDVAGDQQTHTVFSDGHQQITEMAEEARLRGETQLIISDHSHLLTSADIDRQHAEIDSLNEVYRREGLNFRILKGIEANIFSDGTLDAAPEVLARFDVVNGAIHAPQQALGGQQTLFAEANTARLLKAMDNPELDVLVHPHSVAADWDAVARKAADKGIALEVNGRDMLRNDRQEAAADMIAAAKRHGAKLVIGSDAHTTDDLVDLMYALRFAAQHGVTRDDLAPLARRVVRPFDPSSSIPASVDLSSPSTESLGGGMNAVFKIENAAGDQYVVKPEPDWDRMAEEQGFSGPLREQITPGNDLGRERATYIVSRYFNEAGGEDFHVNVPAYRISEISHAPAPAPLDSPDLWVLGEKKTMNAGVSEFVPGEEARSWTDPQGYNGIWRHWFDTDPRLEQLRSAGLFDALIGNTDRHAGNFIFGEDGNLWLIDHGLAFPEFDVPDGFGNFNLEELARSEFKNKLTPREVAFLERLRQNWAQIETDLGEVLGSTEIDEMRSRLDHMIEFRDRHGYPASEDGFGVVRGEEDVTSGDDSGEIFGDVTSGDDSGEIFG